jgi:hypothetical protein
MGGSLQKDGSRNGKNRVYGRAGLDMNNVERIRSMCERLVSNAEKNQWWNVVAILNEVMAIAIVEFNEVLKRGDYYVDRVARQILGQY